MKKLSNTILFIFTSLVLNAQSPNLEWAKNFGGSSTDFGYCSALDKSGNIYTTGYFYGLSDFDPGPNTYNMSSTSGGDIFVTKLDTIGNFVWAKRFGAGVTTFNYGTSIKTDTAGNIYITGAFEGTVDFDPGVGTFNLVSSGAADVFVLKLDSSGNFIWAKKTGGNSTENGISIFVNSSAGHLYIYGDFSNTVDFDPSPATFNLTSVGGRDLFILKLDIAGNFIWAKRMGGTLSDVAFSITQDIMGNIYTTGYFEGTADFDPGAGTYNLTSVGSSQDIYITKLDSAGSFLWAKNIGSNLNDYGRAIAADALGNVFITGVFYGTADFDPNSGLHNLVSSGSGDIFITKLDTAGDLVWAKAMGGPSDDRGGAIAIDLLNDIYITGWFSSTADFNPDAVTHYLASAGGSDIFILKINSGGNYLWAKNTGSTASDNGFSIIIDSLTNLYITGVFQNTADFDFNSGTYNLNSSGAQDVFILKVDQNLSIGMENRVPLNDIKIFPNPSNSLFNTSISNQNFIIYVYNSCGVLVLQDVNSETIDLSNEAKGLYLIKVFSEGNLIGTSKIIKQ
jgi:hypothetical protein